MSEKSLRYREIHSTVTLYPALSPADIPEMVLRLFPRTACAVIWLPDRVAVGRCKEGQCIFPDTTALDVSDLMRLRVFSNDAELHIWRTSQELRGRWRCDTGGEPACIVEAHQVLVGTDYAPAAPGFTVIWEARGSFLTLPLPRLEVNNREKRLFIKTHNYIGTINKTGQASYTDCRFVAFTDGREELK